MKTGTDTNAKSMRIQTIQDIVILIPQPTL